MSILPKPLSRFLQGAALCLLLVFGAACGSTDSNEEEQKFPEPPGRPSAQQADTTDTAAVPLKP